MQEVVGSSPTSSTKEVLFNRASFFMSVQNYFMKISYTLKKFAEPGLGRKSSSMSQIVAVRSTPTGGYQINTPGKQVCVLTDRDGVLNKVDQHINTPEQLDAALDMKQIQALARLSQSPDIKKIVVVTNQGGIDAGFMTPEQNNAILERLSQRVEENGGRIDALLFCPNGSKVQIPQGEVNGRKPEGGMLIAAARMFGDEIDLADSFMIGDMSTDIGAGKSAGVETILVETGFGGKDGKCDAKPDHTVADFSAAVDYILSKH